MTFQSLKPFYLQKRISQAFAEDEEQLKEDLKECARKQALSEWYAMQMPPDID